MTAVSYYLADQPRPTRVLIVEDEVVSRRALTNLLTAHGFVTFAVESAEKALQSIRTRTHCPDIVLVDVDLPDMNGMQLLEELGRSEPHIRGVLITASESERVASLLQRGVPLLRKPLDFPALLSLLTRMQRV